MAKYQDKWKNKDLREEMIRNEVTVTELASRLGYSLEYTSRLLGKDLDLYRRRQIEKAIRGEVDEA